jgi:hypothetical protein
MRFLRFDRPARYAGPSVLTPRSNRTGQLRDQHADESAARPLAMPAMQDTFSLKIKRLIRPGVAAAASPRAFWYCLQNRNKTIAKDIYRFTTKLPE